MERVVGKAPKMEENTASVVPLMLQMIHNNYSMGDEGLSLYDPEGRDCGLKPEGE